MDLALGQLDKERVREHISSLLTWASRIVRLAQADDAVWVPDPAEVIRPLDKMVSEAALMGLICSRVLGPSEAVLDLMNSIASRRDVLDRLYRIIHLRPHQWTALGFIWLVLDQFDLGDQDERARILEISKMRLPQPHERTPNRILDDAWFRSILTGSIDPLLGSREIYSCTTLANLDGGPFMGNQDLYALTHAAMYLTDFGRIPFAPIEEGWISPLGLSQLAVGDDDLAAELAMASLMLERKNVPVGIYAIVAALCAKWKIDGHLYVTSYDSVRHANAASKNDYLWYHTYHPTFVFGILASVACITSADITAFMGKILALKHPAQLEVSSAVSDPIRRAATSYAYWSTLLKNSDEYSDSMENSLLRETLDAYLCIGTYQHDVEMQLSILGVSEAIDNSSNVEKMVRRYLSISRHLIDAFN